MRTFTLLLVLLIMGGMASAPVHARPDYYLGDSSVYAGDSPLTRPNIMFLIDNSGAMTSLGSVEPYDPSITYAGSYPREQIYLRNVANATNTNFQTTKFTVDDIVCSKITDSKGTYPEGTFAGVGEDTYQVAFPSGDGYDDATGLVHPRFALEQNGFWYGALDTKGTCPSNENQWENFFTGNFRNYLESIPEPTDWGANTAYEPGDLVQNPDDSSGLKLKCITGGTTGATMPTWPTLSGAVITDGTVSWEALGTVLEMVQYQMEHVVFGQVRDRANMGLMTFGDNNHGGAIVQPVLKAGTADVGGAVNYDKLVAGLAELSDLVNGNTQPVNESLWDAYLYWIGQSGSSDGISSDKVSYPSPIEYWCQSNHLVVLTTGSAGNNSQTKTKVGDVDGDGNDGLVDDVAKLMYDNLPLDISGHQPKVNTHVIQLMTPHVQRLERATDQGHGHGVYRRIDNPQELINALIEILAGILEADSSFVAPVVPASPENRAYSGHRIYLGFFKPMNDEPWYGNLKKFGLNYSSQITAFDASGNEVLATDSEGYFLADDQGSPLVRSFWGTDLDGGLVDAGGVGALLQARITARNLYTYTGSTSELTHYTNQFAVSTDGTPSIGAESLDLVDETEAANLIRFVHGYDAYGDFSSDTTAKRPWVMGDVMHSKPVILNYSKYNFTAENEENINLNKAYVFVGANDGMLHAFKDATGEEAWAFIPPDLLPDLKYLRDTDRHTYYVDNSPIIYVYDADGDGTITSLSPSHPDYLATDSSDDNDRAILFFGMRRGGGKSTIDPPPTDGEVPPAQGSYYALDITDPENPKFLWQLNSEKLGFQEMGQTWSLPRLTKVRVGTKDKIVAVLGAGYDTNEDLRYGQTQSFPDNTDSTTVTSLAPPGEGDVTSLGTSAAYSPRGRGIYVVEIATLDNGVPDFSNSGEKIWGYTKANNMAMDFSFPSDPLVLDRDYDGYTDYVYIGDTGGQLWRLDIKDSSVHAWTGKRIFTANSGGNGTDIGRKIFYKATATLSGADTLLYFGTGDREHPRNTAVIDRFYVIRDRIDDPPSLPMTEDNLVDVTDNDLQDATISVDESSTLRAKLTAPYYTDGTNTYYGWFIRLDENDGEKVLAVPKVFSGTVYFTTYQSATTEVMDDPCEGKLGPSRLYAVNAFTGEAVYNFDSTNDDVSSTGQTVEVLRRSDRSIAIGDGIASEPLILVNSRGAVSVMAGRGGGFFNTGSIKNIDPVFPVYWMKW